MIARMMRDANASKSARHGYRMVRVAPRERSSHKSSTAQAAPLGLRATEVHSMRPYQSVPTVELARRIRDCDAPQASELWAMRAELTQRALEAASPGIGVKHGAPETWGDL